MSEESNYDTPPPLAEEAWYYTQAEKQNGPMTRGQMIDRIASGTIQSNTLVWKKGMTEWLPLQATELDMGAPPPIPSAAQPQEPSLMWRLIKGEPLEQQMKTMRLEVQPKLNKFLWFPIPLWSVLALLLVIYFTLAIAQHSLVEALWRKHHPDIDDGFRQAIREREQEIAREKDAEEMRKIQQLSGTVTPGTPTWWDEQNAQFNKERAERRERLGLPPLPQLKQPE